MEGHPRQIGSVISQVIGQGSPALTGRADPVPGRGIGDASCPICKGAGWLREDFPVGHPSFGRAIQCECLAQQIEDREFAQLVRHSNMESFDHMMFRNFDPEVSGVAQAYRAARHFANDPRGWLMLMGPFGCGKTHLAAAIANHAIGSKIKVLFALVPDLLDHLRATFAPTSELTYDELFERVRTTFLLVLDDLGTEYSTPWAQEKLYQIFSYRYHYELPTVVTTNRQPEDLDPRVWSLMEDEALCRVVRIEAASYRRRKPGERRATRGGRR
ncbi:MAG: ATP-binding protein [Chloroflexi bacterium]|nr:ATP-binding protein [Chloroflexota bacterium]